MESRRNIVRLPQVMKEMSYAKYKGSISQSLIDLLVLLDNVREDASLKIDYTEIYPEYCFVDRTAFFKQLYLYDRLDDLRDEELDLYRECNDTESAISSLEDKVELILTELYETPDFAPIPGE